MDLGKIVTYEHIHELAVTFPNSDLKLGLVLGIRSASSEQAKSILRKHTNEQLNGGRGRQKRLTAEKAEENELEATAACIAWSRWGKGDARKAGDGAGTECTYNGEKPDLSVMANGIDILDKLGWLYGQVKEASTNLENFMPNALNVSKTSSVNSSSTTQIETSTDEQGASAT